MEMKREEKKEGTLWKMLTPKLKKMLGRLNGLENIQEIRVRVNKPIYVVCEGNECLLKDEEDSYKAKEEDLRELLESVSRYSLYAYEQEMKHGYITVEGGHRIGVAGKVIMEGDKIRNMKYISSMNIRVSHEIRDCANHILPYIVHKNAVCHTLIISPPGCGKTTLLRDIIRQVSYGNKWIKGCTIGVVDERSEIGGCYKGVSQNDVGPRTDILDCCAKVEGMMMLVRAMSPEVIAVDEIGTKEDVHAIEQAMSCGCKMLATVHGQSVEEIKKKPFFQNWIMQKQFERYIVLGKANKPGVIDGVFDERGTLLYRGGY